MTALVLTFTVGACSTDAQVGLLAHCRDLRSEVAPASVACRVDEAGHIDILTDTALDPGTPLFVDHTTDRVVALDRDLRVVVVSTQPVEVVAQGEVGRAYGFDDDGALVSLDTEGTLRGGADQVMLAFEVNGAVDVTAGIDIYDTSTLFSVTLRGGGFSVNLGDVATAEVHELTRADQFVGQARWSPDGTRVAFVGAGYDTIEVVDRAGAPVVEIRPDESRLSGTVNAPSWIDNDSIVFVDAVPALLFADARDGSIERSRLYDADAEPFPVLPVVVP